METWLCRSQQPGQLACPASCRPFSPHSQEAAAWSPSGIRKHSRTGSWLDVGLIFQANSFSRQKASWWFGSDVLPAAVLNSSWEPGPWGPPDLSPNPTRLLYVDKSPNLLSLWFLSLSLSDEDDYTSLTGHWWGLNEVMLIKCVAESLAHGTPSRNTNPWLSEL